MNFKTQAVNSNITQGVNIRRRRVLTFWLSPWQQTTRRHVLLADALCVAELESVCGDVMWCGDGMIVLWWCNDVIMCWLRWCDVAVDRRNQTHSWSVLWLTCVLIPAEATATTTTSLRWWIMQRLIRVPHLQDLSAFVIDLRHVQSYKGMHAEDCSLREARLKGKIRGGFLGRGQQHPSTQSRVLGERCELLQQGLRYSPDCPKVFHYFQHSGWPLLTLILLIVDHDAVIGSQTSVSLSCIRPCNHSCEPWRHRRTHSGNW